MLKTSDVTIVVPTRGRLANVERLLGQISHRPLILVSEEGRLALDIPSDLNGATVELAPSSCGSPKAFEVGIEAAKTSHILMLCDDIGPTEPDMVQKLVDHSNASEKGDKTIIFANDGLRHTDFPFLPKRFYMEEIYPTPYARYCLDNEICQKGRRLGLAARADHVMIPHLIEGGHDEEAQKADNKLMWKRMADFVHRRSTEVTRKVFIAAPIYRVVDVNFFFSMMQQVKSEACDGQIETHVGECPIGRARNDLARKFLESDCTHILFIDSDILFGPDQVKRILDHDEDVVGGFYPIKTEGDPRMCINPLPGPPQVTENDLLKVRYIGTGFLRISRRALELMIQHFGDEVWYTRDYEPIVKEYDFFPMGIYKYPDGTRRWLSEDWYFCQRWMDLGGDVYADLRVTLKHSGNVLFPLKTQEEKLFKQARLGTSASGAEVVPTAPTGAPCLT